MFSRLLIEIFAVIGSLQLMLAGVYVYFFRRSAPVVADDRLPSTLVVLCVRGADPYMADCLRGLLTQDHPDYRVQVVVDSATDPAWSVINSVRSELPAHNLSATNIGQYHTTCSRKISAQLTALQNLPDDIQAVAFIDADVVPHKSWLRELVQPLADPRIQLTSGNRWFRPAQPTIGSYVRYWYNLVAVPIMFYLRIPWGGTMAISRDVATSAVLKETWQHALSDDVALGQLAFKHSWRLKYIPNLLALNTELCSVKWVLEFIHRQLFCTRTASGFWLVLIAEIVILVGGILALPLMIVAFSWQTVLGAAAALVFPLLAAILLLESAAARALCVHQSLMRLSLKHLAMMTFALPVTIAVYIAAICKAAASRKMLWRGITYTWNPHTGFHVAQDRGLKPPHFLKARSHATLHSVPD